MLLNDRVPTSMSLQMDTSLTDCEEQDALDSPNDTKSLLEYLSTLPACQNIVYQEEDEDDIMETASVKPKTTSPLEMDLQILKFCLQLPVVEVSRSGKSYKVELPCSCRMAYLDAWRNFRLSSNNKGDGKTSCPNCLTDVMTRRGFLLSVDKQDPRIEANQVVTGDEKETRSLVPTSSGEGIHDQFQGFKDVYDLAVLSEFECQIQKAQYKELYKKSTRSERRLFLSRRYRLKLAAARLVGR